MNSGSPSNTALSRPPLENAPNPTDLTLSGIFTEVDIHITTEGFVLNDLDAVINDKVAACTRAVYNGIADDYHFPPFSTLSLNHFGVYESVAGDRLRIALYVDIFKLIAF